MDTILVQFIILSMPARNFRNSSPHFITILKYPVNVDVSPTSCHTSELIVLIYFHFLQISFLISLLGRWKKLSIPF